VRKGVWAVALAVWVAGAAGAAPALTVNGDARAWREVGEAMAKLAALRSYRVRSDMGQGQTMVVEFVNPDRMRMVMGGGQVEVVRVGQEQRVRMAGGPWQCRMMFPAPQPPSGGPPEGETRVTVQRAPNRKVGGEEVRTYRYWFGSKPDAVMHLYVSVRTGLPRRLQVLDQAGKVQTTMDYTDFNADIRISLPPCQDR